MSRAKLRRARDVLEGIFIVAPLMVLFWIGAIVTDVFDNALDRWRQL